MCRSGMENGECRVVKCAAALQLSAYHASAAGLTQRCCGDRAVCCVEKSQLLRTVRCSCWRPVRLRGTRRSHPLLLSDIPSATQMTA